MRLTVHAIPSVVPVGRDGGLLIRMSLVRVQSEEPNLKIPLRET